MTCALVGGRRDYALPSPVGAPRGSARFMRDWGDDVDNKSRTKYYHLFVCRAALVTFKNQQECHFSVDIGHLHGCGIAKGLDLTML